MKLVHDAIDEVNAIESFVSGIAAITELAPGVLRVTYYTMRETENGHPENFVVGHQI